MATAAILGSGSGCFDELDEIDDFVYLKNASGVVIWSNRAYRRFYSDATSPHGRHGRTFLDPTVFNVAKHTDALILGGSDHLECEHIGVSGCGETYLLRTFKLSLRYLKKPGYAILGVTRAVRPLNGVDEDPDFELAQLASRFALFSDRDRELCRLFALGFASGEIAEQLEMTSRNVDLRRKKCLDSLGLEKVVDLARLLTRLSERGYLEIDL